MGCDTSVMLPDVAVAPVVGVTAVCVTLLYSCYAERLHKTLMRGQICNKTAECF